MTYIKLDAYGKINLSLDVISKRDDGYHNINTIMQQINLKDIIIIEEIENGIEIESNHPKVPLDSSNLAYKAAKLIKDKYNIDKGVNIKIEKNIPIASGLAGGSTDSAGVLKGLNTIWDLNLSDEELMELGVQLGADIPFCIMGGTAQAGGIGEKLKKLPSFSDKLILLAKPGFPISTVEVYENLRLDKIKKRPNIDKLIKNMVGDDLYLLGQGMVNVLEEVTLKKHKIIKELKNIMLDNGALGSLMSGSGPTVFGIFDSEKRLYKCKKEAKKIVKDVYIARTI